jgi:Holliday junction DNA helicase RuvB
VRDFAAVRANHEVTHTVAADALSFFEVDELGLDTMDNKILELLVETFQGRPVGLNTLANALGEDAETLEDVYEPYLLQQGLLQRTPKGRVATERAFRHRGVTLEEV